MSKRTLTIAYLLKYTLRFFLCYMIRVMLTGIDESLIDINSLFIDNEKFIFNNIIKAAVVFHLNET